MGQKIREFMKSPQLRFAFDSREKSAECSAFELHLASQARQKRFTCYI